MSKKIGKHLKFYMDYVGDGLMPTSGLCGSAWDSTIDGELLLLFKPDNASILIIGPQGGDIMI